MPTYDIALVLTPDEFAGLLQNYEAWIETIREPLLAVDETLAQDVGTSLFACLEDRRKAAEEKADGRMCNLDELTFLCGDLTAAGEDRSATFLFTEYRVEDDQHTAAGQLVWQDGRPLWRELRGSFVAAYPNAGQVSRAMGIFHKYAGRYLPGDFDWSSHIGPLVTDEDPADYERKKAAILRTTEEESEETLRTMWWS